MQVGTRGYQGGVRNTRKKDCGAKDTMGHMGIQAGTRGNKEGYHCVTREQKEV